MLKALILAAVFTAQPVPSSPADAPTSEDGFVTAKLDVNEIGVVEKCSVLETNAPRDFADNICAIFVAKAKFEPKRDAQGVAQKTSMTQTVRFKLQD